MSMVSYTPSSQSAAEPPLVNNGFWPEIDPADCRDSERLRSDITPARLALALRTAVADINRQLATFQAEQQHEAINSPDEIPLKPWQIPGHHAALYQRAVYATAHADLLERYYDYSATTAAADKMDADNDAADEYRRAARWAVAELLDRPHNTVELI